LDVYVLHLVGAYIVCLGFFASFKPDRVRVLYAGEFQFGGEC
jgi:hypothetical protein